MYTAIDSTRKVGVEIEVESDAHSIDTVHRHLRSLGPSCKWVLDLEEGSLRGGEYGWEIKTGGRGIPISDLGSALTQIIPIMSSSSGTWRGAVHCHVDTGGVPSLASAFAMAYVMDDALFERFSPERRESNFCVPLDHSVTEAQYQLQMFMQPSWSLLDNYGKYRSVNVRALNAFGTLEFRHMKTPATSTSVQSVQSALLNIKDFATVCSNVVSYASSFDDAKQLLTSLDASARSRYFPVYKEESVYHMLQATDLQGNVQQCNLSALHAVLPRSRRGRHREAVPRPEAQVFDAIYTEPDTLTMDMIDRMFADEDNTVEE